MDCGDLRPNLKVKTTKLGTPDGISVRQQKFIRARKAEIIGTVIAAVPGGSGDAWFVEHDGSSECTVGVYLRTELEVLI